MDCFAQLIHQGPERTAVFVVEFLQALLDVDQHFLRILQRAPSKGEIPSMQLTESGVNESEADLHIGLDQFHPYAIGCSMLVPVSQGPHMVRCAADTLSD